MHGRISSTRGGHRSPAPSREQATGDEISPTSSGTEKRRIDAWTDIEHTGRPSQPCAVTRTGDWRRNFAYLQRHPPTTKPSLDQVVRNCKEPSISFGCAKGEDWSIYTKMSSLIQLKQYWLEWQPTDPANIIESLSADTSGLNVIPCIRSRSDCK
ncbi:uncharacterized protein LOC114520276 [Dendronephthya gigantea]|uniref:uncharacterized protein LOC114520276 n=1 Tax=Dendronephthya gigantea TaxID=151771 RepID=UPI001068E6FC|nr:uncharacterized protein LOC114520276 [Dendronephthya gigantea]